MASAIWPTLELTFLAVLAGAGLSIPIGAFMAQARGDASEVAVRIGAIAGLTIPSFWLGIVSILLVSRLFPGTSMLGYVPFTEGSVQFQRMILPVFALSLPMLANLAAFGTFGHAGCTTARIMCALRRPRGRGGGGSSTTMRSGTR